MRENQKWDTSPREFWIELIGSSPRRLAFDVLLKNPNKIHLFRSMQHKTW